MQTSTMCTSTGCFITNECLKVESTLYDEIACTVKIIIAFRIVETLGKK